MNKNVTPSGFISILNLLSIIISSLSGLKSNNALEQLANSLNENDNPVLMLLKLKE